MIIIKALFSIPQCQHFKRKENFVLPKLLFNLPWNNNFFRSLKTSHVRHSRWNRSKSNGSGSPTLKPPEFPFYETGVNGISPVKRLFKPFLFTVGFSAVSIGGSAIWQYETMRRISSFSSDMWTWKSRTYKYNSWRQQLNQWWNNLSEGEKLFVPIAFLNCLVFAAWRVPAFLPFMQRYFCANPFSNVVCLPMVLSTFSHYSLFHLGANMFVLHSFSTGAALALGKEQLLGFYLSAGCISSFASYVHKVFLKLPGPSLGASGAILAVLAYVCTKYPDTQLSIIFLPFFTFSASVGIKAIMALDAAGIAFGWKFFDHAAHLGGALYGIFWYWWGTTYIWKKRGPLIETWHNIRGSKN
uniref:rhomboid protease n=1 Tax=Clastoptera arizonana TaxID=38151 RepID=A0A1B6E5C0_9HEMI